MEENAKQNATGLSKREMARKISGSVNAKNNEDALTRDQDRRRLERELRTRPESRRVDNPYMQGGRDPQAPRPGVGYPRQANELTGKDYDAVFSEIPRTSRPSRKRVEMRNEREAREYVERRRVERAQKRRQQKRKQLIASLVTVIVLIGAAAAGGLIWYNHGMKSYDGIFLENTFINGVRVGKLSVDDAAQLVKQYSDMPDVITLTRPDGVDVTVPLTELDSTDNIRQNVEEFFKDQDHHEWLKARTQKTEYSFKLDFSFNREKLYEEVNRKIVEGQNSTKSENARIERTPDGFQIIPEVVGTAIDNKKLQTLYDFIDGFLDRGSYSIDLKNCNCYKLPKVTSDDLREELGVLNNLVDVEFTLDYGYAQETLSGSQALKWISFDNSSPMDGFTVDEDMVESYVESVAKKYDSFGKSRTFKSTTRGEMTIEQGEGCYGWMTDYDKTTSLLVDLIHEGVSAKFEPYYYETSGGFKYTGKPEWRTAEKDFSDTYCEVDLAAQHFWYYENGKLKYQCDIVSGLPTAARNTPGGVYKVWYKETDKTLVGSTYEGESWSTFVNYWNNISTFGVGLHDAWWHDYFGGDRYLYAGSHGCVNMPYDAAKYVYENIDYDTPVFMYW